MIADISTHNPNVLYELGVRHAVRRGRTLMISAGGPLPSNVGVIQALFYEPDPFGRLTGPAAQEFSDRLRSIIRLSKRTTICDSPVYEYFPDIEVLLPPELESPSAWRGRKRTRSGTGLGASQRAIASPEKVIGEVKRREEEVRSTGADPIEFLTLLRSYRDASAWDELIRLAVEAPASIAESPEVRQLLALALNRRGEPGDQDRAIALMEQLVHETGGDGESLGVLGRIYKDRHDAARAIGDSGATAENLKRALQSYGAGFEKNPKDYYNGVNVVTLLAARGDAAARTELAALLPRVRAAVQEKIDRPSRFLGPCDAASARCLGRRLGRRRACRAQRGGGGECGLDARVCAARVARAHGPHGGRRAPRALRASRCAAGWRGCGGRRCLTSHN